GDLSRKPAHEAQGEIDEYLHQAATDARIYGFLADNAYPTHLHQLTYVDWVSTGLTGIARTAWRRLPEEQRYSMSWATYREWIQKNFSSSLTLQQATDAIDTIKQKGAATTYSQQFNELVAAIESSGIHQDEKLLCIKYRRGLKEKLQENEDLFKIESLQELQHSTERLDDFHWRKGKGKQPQSFQNNRRFRSQQTNDGTTPMEIDNLEASKRQRLTEQEKVTYRANGCTNNATPKASGAPVTKSITSTSAPQPPPAPKPNSPSASRAPPNSTKTSLVERAIQDKKETADSSILTSTTSAPASRIKKAPRIPWDLQQDKHLSLFHVNEEASRPTSLLVIKGQINGKEVSILIDGGAYPSYINNKVASAIKDPSSDDIFSISLASDGSPKLEGRFYKGLELGIEDYDTRHDFVAAAISYDVILGKDWLDSHNPTIDWPTNTVSFGNHKWICHPHSTT
ncbi:hypothetical protein HDU67_004506, partial [Dinochytrium kinnereticum]